MKESELNHAEETKRINGHFIGTTQKSEINHAFENYWLINEKWGKQCHDVQELHGTKGGKSAIICGSGPSLQYSWDLLKQWEGDIFCCNSQGPTLLYHGIEPDYLVEMDNRSAHKDAPWEDTNTSLIMQPGCQRERITKWPNDIYVYLLADPNDEWRTKYMPIAFPWVTAQYLSFATSGTMAVSIALSMGYESIYLIGFDFGGDKDNKRERFDKVEWKDGEWHKKEWDPKHADVNLDMVAENGAPTKKIMVFHKGGFMSMLAVSLVTMQHKMKIANCSKVGTVTELPHIPLEKVIKRQGKIKHFWPVRRYEERIEAYLMRHDKYILRFHNGVQYGCQVLNTKTPEGSIDYVNGILDKQKEYFAEHPEQAPKEYNQEKIQYVNKDKYLAWIERLKKVKYE